MAGVFLTIARNPIRQTSNAWADLFTTLRDSGQPIFGALALFMSVLVIFGGATICIGGLLSFKGHLRSGKELIGLGTGVGLADLLLLAHSGTFGPPEWLGWGGLFLAVLAGRHIHGPEASYAGELRRMIGTLRARIMKRNRKEAKRRRSRRIRVRQAGALSREYDLSRNKKGEG